MNPKCGDPYVIHPVIVKSAHNSVTAPLQTDISYRAVGASSIPAPRPGDPAIGSSASGASGFGKRGLRPVFDRSFGVLSSNGSARIN